MNKFCTLIVLGCFGCFFSQCSKTDQFQSAQIDEYVNLAAGKYIIYRLDSIKFINFGQKDTPEWKRFILSELIPKKISDD